MAYVKVEIDPFRSTTGPIEPPRLCGILLETWKTFIFILLNMVSSVGIVVTNKWVFYSLDFNFGTALTVVHFFITYLGLELASHYGLFEKKRLSFSQILPLSASFCGFVVLTNLSLQYNSVGFYQMAKVLTTPCIVLIQSTFYHISFSQSIKSSLVITCLGVMIASVNDIQLNLTGTVFAVCGVVIGSLYQIWIGTQQKELNLNSMQLLHNQSLTSFILLSFFVPMFEDVKALVTYQHSVESLFFILLSALLALVVNLSTFLVIGRACKYLKSLIYDIAAVTYNVAGHCKLSLVLLLGFMLFNSSIDLRQLCGILIAFIGIFWYSYLKLK